ncbi:MAG: cobalamin-independent methionine synthase II family protein [Alphaproteobacteria bacterium]
MKLSTDRILTTHVGSLPRPQALLDILLAQDRNEAYDAAALDKASADAVRDCVRKQVEAGIDVICDGEMSKPAYTFYVRHRLTGVADASEVVGEAPVRPTHADVADFPELAELRAKARAGSQNSLPQYCVGDIAYKNIELLEADIAHMKAAMADAAGREVFMNAASPGVLAIFIPNTHYPNEDAYVEALADAMRTEYERIVEAGFVLQLDCPDIGMGRHTYYQNETEPDYLKKVARNVEALNHATANIPREMLRLHICWGNYPAPHLRDIEVTKLFDAILGARPQALVFEASNPRHEHEWEDWANAAIPDDTVLIPGVVDSTANYVEHPRLIAQRLKRFTDIVGQERVLAGTDCGYGTFAGMGHVLPSIVWAKLKALAEGAALASA